VSLNAPVAIRYPRGEACGARRAAMKRIPLGRSELLRDGSDAAVIGVGPILNCALKAADELELGGIRARVVNARFVKPLDEAAIVGAASECGALVLLEENSAEGGFGAAVLECLAANNALGIPVEIVALPDRFLGHGRPAELLSECGVSTPGIVEAVNRALARADLQALSPALSFRTQ